MSELTKQQIIQLLQLEPHPNEGGYFRRTYTSNHEFSVSGEQRFLASSIYYLLTDDSPIGVLHRNRSDIIHYFHFGGAIRYHCVNDQGEYYEHLLGNGLDQSQLPQLLVPGNTWKASELISGSFALISEVVIPGFEYADNEIAAFSNINHLPDPVLSRIQRFIKH